MTKIDLCLYRIMYGDHGAIGFLAIPFGNVRLGQATPICLTLEPDWKNNEPFMSCIPSGTYMIKRVESPKHGITFEVTGVNGRTHILFHKGNKSSDTQGCILTGEKFNFADGQPIMQESKHAFDELMNYLKGKNVATLEVIGNKAVESDILIDKIIKRRDVSKLNNITYKELSLEEKLKWKTVGIIEALKSGYAMQKSMEKGPPKPLWKRIVFGIVNPIYIAGRIIIAKYGIKLTF